MVTVIESPKTKTNGNGHRPQSSGAGGAGDDGGGGRRDGRGDNRQPQPERDETPIRFRIGIAVTFATIIMMFASLTIAYLCLSQTSPDWRAIQLPRLLWVSTALILSSSVTFEFARRAWRRGTATSAQTWLLLTTLLGAGFIASQFFCWQQLVAQQIYLEKNPYRSFFYMLTGLHALHIVGGIAALVYLLLRVRRVRRAGMEVARAQHSAAPRLTSVTLPALSHAAIDTGALYWHFVDGLWVYVFMLLLLWQ